MHDIQKIIERLNNNDIPYKENEPLSAHSTFRIGGNSRIFATPRNETELKFVLECANDAGIRYFIAGKGSNIVYPDDGFDGIIISTYSMSAHCIEDSKIIADAGASLTELAVVAAKNSLTGLEFAYGIPGSLGGAVFMNAGAYGGEMSMVVTKSRYYDTTTKDFGEISDDHHKFGYRESVYREHPEWVILSAEISLSEGNKEDIEAAMNDYISRRREKQPLEYPSAGSAFKRYPGRYTAQMIDEAGLKGFSVGGAQVSEKHAGFIINKGGATAADVLQLSNIIKEKIFDLHGIEIESEIIFVK